MAGPCITLGLVLRETARRISYRDRHGRPKFISKGTLSPAHHVLIIRRRNTRIELQLVPGSPLGIGGP